MHLDKSFPSMCGSGVWYGSKKILGITFQTYGTAWKLEMDNCESLNVYSLAVPWTMRSCHPVGYH